MTERRRFARSVTVRQAACVVFALVAILPILIAVYLLSRADLLGRTETWAGLLLAVTVAGLGFFVFLRTVDRVARLAQGPRTPATETSGLPAPPTSQAGTVPGLRAATEVGQVAGAFDSMLGDLRGATDRLEDLVFKLGSLNEVVELAARVPRIQDLLGLVLQTTMRAVHATIGSIMILDRASQTLRLSASRGIPDDVALHAEVKVGEGIAGKVVELGEPVLVDDIETDPRFKKPNAPRYGSGSFICMPIRAGDRIIGVINMAKKGEPQPEARRADPESLRSGARRGEPQPEATPGDAAPSAPPRPPPFSPIDVQFLNALLTYIGYAVDNARLLEEAQQSATRLQVVVDDLKLTQERLVRGETLRAIGQLAAGMAHHLNNIFAVILGRTELLLASADGSGIRRPLEIVQRAAKDGAEVARRVQRFSQLQPAPESTAVDLARIVQEAVDLARSRVGAEVPIEEGLVEFAVEPGPIPAVAGEPIQLREVLMNILQNAMEAMPHGGEVKVRTWATGERVYCAIADTGVGMSEEARHRALEPFFTTKGPKSTGLGLSVAYGAIQRCGGSLGIESAAGRGTTVTLSLPAVGPEGPARSAAPASRTPLRILVIADDTQAREAVADMLGAHEHRVVQAADGRVGVGLLRTGERFDVALIDLRPAGTSGWELVQAIRAAWPGLGVGVISRAGESPTPEERGRVDFVITEPIDSARLDEAVTGISPR